jgi:hypothetical protein
MKALRVITACAAVVLALTATPVAAGDHDGWSRRSVFPRPSDPWRHWGHAHSPHVIVPPRAVIPHRGHFMKSPVWVQGFWGWNGFHWVWVPGH